MTAFVRYAALVACTVGGTAAALVLGRPDVRPPDVRPERATPSGDPSELQEMTVPYDGQYQFVRIRFDARGRGGFGGFGRGGREPMWAHDYPRADRNFLKIVDETTHVRTTLDGTNVLTTDDPRLFQHPIAYIVEVGAWDPSEEEVAGLSAYLRKGGFLIVDDFRGRYALDNLAYQVARIVPGARLMPLPDDHRIFDSFFRVVPHEVIPPYGNEPPVWFAVYEDNDPSRRIMMVINYNNDIGDYWEYSDYGYYPIDLSNEAYKLGVNYIVYAYTN
ncbi:MAG: DUF4159 domain-containing protein [Gemmatimonadota bacterium]